MIHELAEKLGIEIKFSEQKSLELFKDALSNGLGYLRGYDIEEDYSKKEYQQAREKLETPCYEDVLIQILKDGGSINFVDYEENGITTIHLEDVINNMPKVPLKTLLEVLEERGDAISADVILQTIIFGKVIYG